MSGSISREALRKERLSNLQPMDAHVKRKQLRERLASGQILVVPGAYDAASAALIEQCGFESVHATGAGISCVLGFPDIGLVSMREVVDHVTRMVEATRLPLIADADTGYGNQLNTVRAVRAFESAGVAALHLEDQVFPKKCGLLSGREVVPIPEMVAKLHAALDARRDESLVIIARTDARDALGLDAVIERGQAFSDAGADMVFVYGAQSVDELSRIGKEVPGPLMTHVSRGSKFSDVTPEQLRALGYGLVIHALGPLEVALHAVREYLRELRTSGNDLKFSDRMLTYQELYGLVGLEDWLEIESDYAVVQQGEAS